MKEKEEKALRKEMLATASEEMKYLSDESDDWELDDRELDMIAGGGADDDAYDDDDDDDHGYG